MKYYYWIIGDVSSEFDCPFCGGVVLVSANCAEEAKQFAMNNQQIKSLIHDDYINIDYVYELRNVQEDTEPRLLISEYYIE